MENLKEQKPNAEVVQAVDVELNEEQLDVVAGGVWGDDCTGGPHTGPKGIPDKFLPKAPDVIENMG